MNKRDLKRINKQIELSSKMMKKIEIAHKGGDPTDCCGFWIHKRIIEVLENLI